MDLYIYSILPRLFLFICSVNLIDINECDSDPCQNNGECKNTLGSYYCVCPRGFLGTNCGSGNSTIVHIKLITCCNESVSSLLRTVRRLSNNDGYGYENVT